MSGGSLDYFYSKLNDAIEQVRARATTPLHVAFADHLGKVSIALHDLEWEWSCDYGTGDADPAIRVVVTATDEVSSSMKQVGELLAELEQVVVSAKAIAKKGTP